MKAARSVKKESLRVVSVRELGITGTKTEKEWEVNYKDGKIEGFVKRNKNGLISEEGYWKEGKSCPLSCGNPMAKNVLIQI